MKIKITALLIASLLVILLTPPKARAIVENQIVGFFGVTPVLQQAGTQDLVTSLKAYGLIGAGATPISTAQILITTGTAAPIAAGQLALSGTNLLFYTGTAGGWKTVTTN